MSGDVIYLLDTAAVKEQCRKLSWAWKGPVVVTKVLTPALLGIKIKNAVFIVNHDRLKS